MTPGELKTILVGILNAHERLRLENVALRAVMQFGAPRNPGEPPLEEQANAMIADPEAQARVHGEFAPLYQQIEAAAQEAELLELLARYPPAGQPN
jgi:hypothetical protein